MNYFVNVNQTPETITNMNVEIFGYLSISTRLWTLISLFSVSLDWVGLDGSLQAEMTMRGNKFRDDKLIYVDVHVRECNLGRKFNGQYQNVSQHQLQQHFNHELHPCRVWILECEYIHPIQLLQFKCLSLAIMMINKKLTTRHFRIKWMWQYEYCFCSLYYLLFN